MAKQRRKNKDMDKKLVEYVLLSAVERKKLIKQGLRRKSSQF